MSKTFKVGDEVNYQFQGGIRKHRINKIFKKGKFKGWADVGKEHAYIPPEQLETLN